MYLALSLYESMLDTVLLARDMYLVRALPRPSSPGTIRLTRSTETWRSHLP